MLILNVIDNGLACDCFVCRVLIMTYHRFCKKKIREKWVVILSILYLVYSIHGKLLFFYALRRLENRFIEAGVYLYANCS